MYIYLHYYITYTLLKRGVVLRNIIHRLFKPFRGRIPLNYSLLRNGECILYNFNIKHNLINKQLYM